MWGRVQPEAPEQSRAGKESSRLHMVGRLDQVMGGGSKRGDKDEREQKEHTAKMAGLYRNKSLMNWKV